MGPGLRARLRRDAALAAALRDALSLRPVPDPGRALRRRRCGARRTPQLRRRGPRRHLPPGDLRPRRRACCGAHSDDLGRVVARRSASPRARPAGAIARRSPFELADGLPRIAGRPRASRGGTAPAATATPAGWSWRPRRPRARWRACAQHDGARADVVLHTERMRRSSRPSRARLTAGWSRSTASAASTSRACAWGSMRRRPRRRSSSARSWGASCARSPGARSTAAGSSCPPTRACARAAEVERELRHVLRPPDEEDDGALDEVDARRASERGEVEAFVPVAADVGAPARPVRRRPRAGAGAVVPVGDRRARRGDDAGLRAPRAPARQAPPAGGRPAPAARAAATPRSTAG